MQAHRDHQGASLDLPVGKVVCVGRNYLDHIQELHNTVPDDALLFIKPSTAVCDMHQPIRVPTRWGDCHNELELAVLIGREWSSRSQTEVIDAIWGYGLALDLTLRDQQHRLKDQGAPWERAKAFDGSCPLSGFVPRSHAADVHALAFTLDVNGERRQNGHTSMMIRSVTDLLREIGSVFTLLPGDVVLTGTPKGVGPLAEGDHLAANLGEHIHIQTTVECYD